MARPIPSKAAVRGGLGLCTLHQPQITRDADGNVTAITIDTSPTALSYWTGRLYQQKVVQITSNINVSAEGLAPSTLETTDSGPKVREFFHRFIPMYRRPGQQATAGSMEILTDETGWTDEQTVASDVPLEDMLIMVLYGGDYINTDDGTSWFAPIDILLVSIGNESKSVTNSANTWRRKNWVLNSHLPPADITVPVSALKAFFTANNVGANFVGAEPSTLTQFVLPKDVAVIEYDVELSKRVA